MSYISVEEAKEYIGGISGGGDDALLKVLIDSAQAYIEMETGRVFEHGTAANKSFDAVRDVDGATLYFDDMDLCSITTVTNGDGVVVASDEYVTEPRRRTPYYAITLLPSSDKSWTYDEDPQNAIVISGKWAYSVTAPAAIKQACLDIVKTLYRSRDANAGAGQTIISGGLVITPADVPSVTRRILQGYRRI